MAVLLPLFLFLLLIVVDFGRLFATQVAITNAAREGAYYAAQHQQGAAGATTAAQQEAPGSTVTVKYCPGDAGCPVVTAPTVVVSASQPFTFWTPFIAKGFGPIWGGFGTLTVGASATGEPL